jgi:hypothetical protein
MFRKTVIALAATAAVLGATAATASAKTYINFGLGFGGYGPGYGYGGGFYDDDYCGWHWVKKKVWVKVAPGVFVKKKIIKKVYSCW